MIMINIILDEYLNRNIIFQKKLNVITHEYITYS